MRRNSLTNRSLARVFGSLFVAGVCLTVTLISGCTQPKDNTADNGAAGAAAAPPPSQQNLPPAAQAGIKNGMAQGTVESQRYAEQAKAEAAVIAKNRQNQK